MSRQEGNDIKHGAPANIAVPITILTGFLGAGKTTLLNRILTGDHGLRVAVLVNDFGAINIDAELVVGVESNVVSLANGCICCSIRDDLVAAVLDTIDRPERPEYILLEASGVAEPTGIAATFTNTALRDRIRTDSIVCVVDAEQVFAAPELMELKIFQMACADLIVLNKTDLVDAKQIGQIEAWLDSRFHRYRLIRTRHCEVPLGILLPIAGDANRIPEVAAPADERDTVREADHSAGVSSRHHGTMFRTWAYATNRPLSLAAVQEAATMLPADIYRVKGIINSLDAPRHRAILQVVGRRVDLALAEEWGDRKPRTSIVAIGSTTNKDEHLLESLAARCFAGS